MPHEMKYDVFISYSHAVSSEIAFGLQKWLQQFANPWWRRRSIRVFRDATDLSLSPDLWQSVLQSLNQSRWLVLLASPGAAESKWVKREVRYWLGDIRSSSRLIEELDAPLDAFDAARLERLLIVLVDGEIAWQDGNDSCEPDFNWSGTTALPRCLSGVYCGEPLWVDFRSVIGDGRNRKSLDRSNPEFMESIARLSSKVRGIELAVLISEDSRRHRQAIRTAWQTGIALVICTLLAVLGAWAAMLSAHVAIWQREVAEAERSAAEARALAALEPDKLAEAGLAAREAYLSLVALSESPPAPQWLLLVQRWLNRRGVTITEGWAAALGVSIEPRHLATADEIMRLADDLTPSLLHELTYDEETTLSKPALRPGSDSVSFISAANMIETWTFAGQRGTMIFDVPTFRVNNDPVVALSGNGTVVAVESAEDNLVGVYGTDAATMPLHTIDPSTIFPPEAFAPRPLADSEGGSAITESFSIAHSFVGPLPARSQEPRLAGLALNLEGDRLMVITQGGFGRLLSVGRGDTMRALGEVWRLEMPADVNYMRMSQWILDGPGELLAATPSSFTMKQAPVAVWNSVSGAPVMFATLEDDVEALAFSRDSKLFAIGLANGNISVWNIEDGAVRTSLFMGAPVNALAFGIGAADGMLLSGGVGFARVFDLETGREIARAPHKGGVAGVGWAPEGDAFFTASSDLRVWNIQDAQRFAPARMRCPFALETIACAGSVVAAIEWPYTAHIWDASSGDELAAFNSGSRIAIAIDAHGQEVSSPSYEPDTVALRFRLADKSLDRLGGPPLTSDDADEDSYVATAEFDDAVKYMVRSVQGLRESPCIMETWDLETRQRLSTFPCGGSTYAVAISPDGTHVAWIEGVESRQVRVNTIEGGPAWSDSLTAGTVLGPRPSVVFSDDGRLLAASSETTVQVFDAASGLSTRAPIRFDNDVVQIAFDPSGARLLAALVSRRLLVLDLNQGTVLASHPYSSRTSSGDIAVNDEYIYAVFSDDNVNNPRIWRWRVDVSMVAEAIGERLPPMVSGEGSLAPAQLE